MKAKVPVVLLAALYLLFFGSLWFTFDQLPARVATHFGAGGRADGWMSREAHLWFTIALAIGLPGLIVVALYVVRFLPASMLNLPNREYWIAPERRKQTYDFLFHHSLWFACLALAFVTGIHLSTVAANKIVPPTLSTGNLVLVAGGFLVGMFVWIVTLLWPFLKEPPSRS